MSNALSKLKVCVVIGLDARESHVLGNVTVASSVGAAEDNGKAGSISFSSDRGSSDRDEPLVYARYPYTSPVNMQTEYFSIK